MSFSRTYSADLISRMTRIATGKEMGRGLKVELIGRKYPGTKTKPFTTFGVTAAIKGGGQIHVGTGVAPVATSGGVREPEAVSNDKLAKKHLRILEQYLNSGEVNLLDPIAVDNAVLEIDQALAKERGLKKARPTSGIGSEVAISATVALLDAQAAYFQLPTVLAMRAILLQIQGKEQNADGLRTPLPKFNILNFGGHSATKRKDGFPYVQIQETKVATIGAADFEEAEFMGIATLDQIIKLAGVDNIGFEAGISPALTEPEQIYQMAAESIALANLTGKMVIAADAAASEFSKPKSEDSDIFLYNLFPGRPPVDQEGMVRFWVEMVNKYPIVSIEDGMNSEDPIGWKMLMSELGNRIEIQGDDLFVTDAEELDRLHECANSVLVKPNQAGTIVRTLRLIAKARQYGYTISPSHRSGKVPGGYGMIPELALATQAEWIKPGAPRRERQGFTNNVMTFADELALLGINVGYAGPVVAKRFSI
ncbi:MAG: hypothetical protein PHH14_04550 [Candidatus Margulisbacteria bacterium]|nr:hypothetical protein [Candidatus Margulisiibacteriota bacterium]